MKHRALRWRIGPLETFGLKPLLPALRQCLQAIVGDPYSAGTRFGLSSLRMFHPTLSLPTWLGLSRPDRRAPLINLFNRRAPSLEGGAAFDVRVTDVEDFRGGGVSYNTHFGVDFAVPVGTRVAAPAPGIVRRVENLMHRGGLKFFIDHGAGLITLGNHLSRAFVEEGQVVRRGEVIGLSGMSSVDGLIAFPWLAPHLHFSAILNGEAVDPFAREGEQALWIDGNDPKPAQQLSSDGQPWGDDEWDPAGVADAIAACRSSEHRLQIERLATLAERGAAIAYWRYFSAGIFERYPQLYRCVHPRQPRLCLPFAPEDVSGVAFIPVGLRRFVNANGASV